MKIKPLSRKRERLIEDHASLARSIARNIKRRQPPWIQLDDLIGAAQIGLVKAAHKYKPASGVPFEAFARIKIHGAVMDSLRRRNFQHNSTLQLYEDHADNRVITEPMLDLEDSMDQEVMQRAVREAVDRMPESDRKKIIVLRYFRGKTGRQAGQVLGIQESASCHLHQQAISELRRVMDSSPDRQLLRAA